MEWRRLFCEWPHFSPASRAFSPLQLFEYVADCLADFMKTKGLMHKKLPLGLTFSFPCAQTKLEEVRHGSGGGGEGEAVQGLEFGTGACMSQTGNRESAGILLLVIFFLFL